MSRQAPCTETVINNIPYYKYTKKEMLSNYCFNGAIEYDEDTRMEIWLKDGTTIHVCGDMGADIEYPNGFTEHMRAGYEIYVSPRKIAKMIVSGGYSIEYCGGNLMLTDAVSGEMATMEQAAKKSGEWQNSWTFEEDL